MDRCCSDDTGLGGQYGGDSSFKGKGPALAREARAVDRRATVGKCIMTKWKIKPGVD